MLSREYLVCIAAFVCITLSSSTDPLVSIVISLRNDNYGGEAAFARYGRFFENINEALGRHNVDLELVVVEWNPPAENEPLHEKFAFGQLQNIPIIRVITVPPAIHQKMKMHHVRGMFEFTAKNVGMRRARGKYVLCINGDDILSDGAWEFLESAENLDENAYYRVPLQNSNGVVPADTAPSDVTTYVRDRVFRIVGRDSHYMVSSFKTASMIAKDTSSFWEREFRKFKRAAKPFTDGCGDFTMMSKKNWFYLRGYDEETVQSYYHWDSVLLYKAWYAGIREIELFPPIEMYHMWHEKNAKSNIYKNLTNSYQMIEFLKSGYFQRLGSCTANPSSWGNAEHQFEETHFYRGAKNTSKTFGSDIIEKDRKLGYKELPECQGLLGKDMWTTFIANIQSSKYAFYVKPASLGFCPYGYLSVLYFGIPGLVTDAPVSVGVWSEITQQVVWSQEVNVNGKYQQMEIPMHGLSPPLNLVLVILIGREDDFVIAYRDGANICTLANGMLPAVASRPTIPILIAPIVVGIFLFARDVLGLRLGGRRRWMFFGWLPLLGTLGSARTKNGKHVPKQGV